SAGRLETSLKHLRPFFGLYRAIQVTSDLVTSYVVARQAEGAANATINRELAALKRMFTLGKRGRRGELMPYVPMLKEDNTRKGFSEAGEFRAIVANLPAYLAPALETAYITGWRIRDELLTRHNSHVDLQNGWLRLEPGETKNGEGRNFPLTSELRFVLEAQVARTRELEKSTGVIIPWLFHRNGKPIKEFRRAWKT